MKPIRVKPVFNFFILRKYNFGLWKMPYISATWYPKFSGYSWASHSKYGISWFGYLLEFSYIKPHENRN